MGVGTVATASLFSKDCCQGCWLPGCSRRPGTVVVLKAVLTLTEVSSSSWTTEQYGFPDVAPSFFWYLQTMPGVITNFITGLFGLGCVAFLFAQRPYRLLLSLTFVLMYVGMGLRQGTLAWMNFAAVCR